ncbi:MAG: hypothetical protein KF790_12825 [Steroidobacteraceae bacterium]|nr:hypothetical protein [Steroidobacteraceae bacterium]MCW5573394.1 hypothetical protein [Steroidobacteraceae bacterium]
MRYATLVLGILGGLMAGFLGGRWITDLQKVDMLGRAMAQATGTSLGSMQTAAYLLILAMFAGIVGGVMAFRGSAGRIPGIAMLLTGAVPVLFSGQTLVFTFLLIVAGVLALVHAGRVSRRGQSVA